VRITTETIERYLREGRTVSGGCGPSSSLKTLNKSVQGLLTSAKSEAATVFGASSTVFNNLMKSIQSIVAGGPSQMGYSANELSALNAAAVEAGATEARNLRGAAAGAVGAIGGGNVALPSGGTQAAVMSANQKAAADTAAAENAITQANYAQGNQNYQQAVKSEMALPEVFNPATSATDAATKAAGAASDVEKQMSASENWWQPMLGSVLGATAGVATAGLMKNFNTPAPPPATPGT